MDTELGLADDMWSMDHDPLQPWRESAGHEVRAVRHTGGEVFEVGIAHVPNQTWRFPFTHEPAIDRIEGMVQRVSRHPVHGEVLLVSCPDRVLAVPLEDLDLDKSEILDLATA